MELAARERARMVHALVRWGGESVDHLAYKHDHEIKDMADRLKLSLVVPDLGAEARRE